MQFVPRIALAVLAGIVGAFVLAATVANLLMLPHPTWVAVAGVAGICVGAYAAGNAVDAHFARTWS